MSLLDTLLEQGFTLPGQNKKVIEEPGGDAVVGGDISPLGRLGRQLKAEIVKTQIEDEKRQKKMQEQASTYQTLRESGYSPAKAHAAVISGNIPKEIAEEQDKIALDAEKAKADIAKVKAEAEAAGNKKNSVEARIMNKIANGDELTVGEQKIYDDVIKKGNNAGLAGLLDDLQPNEGTPTIDADVPVISPTGIKGKVKASRLNEFLKKGYKRSGVKN